MSHRTRVNLLQGMLGDLPQGLAPDAAQPLPYSRGFDTTGTRRTVPGQQPPGAGQFPATGKASLLFSPALFPFRDVILAGFDALYRRATFYPQAFTASNAAVLQVRPQEDRTYFLVQNNSAAVMYLGIGYAPSPSDGIQLAAGAVYEPFQVPQNEIYILGSAAGQSGVVLYANG